MKVETNANPDSKIRRGREHGVGSEDFSITEMECVTTGGNGKRKQSDVDGDGDGEVTSGPTGF